MALLPCQSLPNNQPLASKKQDNQGPEGIVSHTASHFLVMSTNHFLYLKSKGVDGEWHDCQSLPNNQPLASKKQNNQGPGGHRQTHSFTFSRDVHQSLPVSKKQGSRQRVAGVYKDGICSLPLTQLSSFLPTRTPQ